MDETFKEFSIRIRKADQKRNRKKSVTTRKMAAEIKRNNKEFKHISLYVVEKLINRMFELIAEDIFDKGRIYRIPYGIGVFFVNIYKNNKKFSYNNLDKCLKTNWNETLKMWYDNPGERGIVRNNYREYKAKFNFIRGRNVPTAFYFFDVIKQRSVTRKLLDHLDNKDIIGFVR